MAKNHFKPSETLQLLEPGDLGLIYTSLQRLEIAAHPVLVKSGSNELCLVVIEGELSYRFEGKSANAVMGDMLYLPIESAIELSNGPAVAIRYGAPCQRKTSFAHIAFKDVDADGRHKVYGKVELGTRRDVWNCLDEAFDSSRLLMGICYGAPGGWTAWPPHEHGAKREEVYVYFNMGDGFGLQCVYEDMQDPNAIALVQNGHMVAIPAGYHPNVGCPKTGIRYIYCMVSTTAEDRRFMDLHTQLIYGDKLE